MKKPHVVAIIQARLGSTRLPGKTMMDLAGKTMLEHVLFRMKHSKMLDRVVVATTDSESDKVIIEAAGKMGVDWFAGSEEDVLDRFYQAAKKFGADVVVRLTADCPLNDPAVVDKAVKLFLESDADYVSNTVEHTYPNGVDVEVFSMQSLERAWNEGKLISEREHVTTHIWKHPEKFKIIQFTNDRDLSDYRWTVDEPQDAELIRKIFAELGSDKVFSMDEVIALFEREPELKKLNDGIRRNEGYSKCLREDRKVGGEKSEWKPTVVFRLDANFDIGSGHLSRCLSLANEMKRQGCGKIVFACRDSEDFKGKIESSGYKFVPIEAENTEQDAIKTAAAAYQEGAETIVVDTYGIDVDYLTYLKKRIEVLAVIDDNRLLGNYDVDVIVNQNLHAAKLDYSVSEGAEKLLGPKYAILRDEFGPSDFRREVGEAKRILVTFGASDMKGANPVCAEALKRLDGDKEFRFIIGRLTKKEELEKVIGDDKRFSLLQDISNMAEQIRWCDMMVLSPGTTTYEAIRFSTPGIFIVQAENQELVGDSINEKEVGLCLGKIEQLDSEKIYDALTTVSSEEERMKMISAMDEMVDGKGAERVAKAILSKVKKRL